MPYTFTGYRILMAVLMGSAVTFSPSLWMKAQNITIENAFEQLTFNAPLDFQRAPGIMDTVFVIERAGTIQRFRNHPQTDEVTQVLDIRPNVSTRGEGGLLGAVFHPDFVRNGWLFVYYTTSDPDPGIPLRSVIARFETDPDQPEQFDPDSEWILLDVEQPADNHNGGQIRFGPDGYLYIALGDGGGSGDPYDNGQDRSTLHGNILRIDVDHAEEGLNYAIPQTNPFSGNKDGWREEIYAWGFRNPFRFSFDPDTGKLWVADVGQRDREEVNIVEPGKNYGWNIMEGSICYPPGSVCDTAGLELPVYEYGFSGGQSITGGFVYRGNDAPSARGRYFYGDYVTGDLWSFAFDGFKAFDNQHFGKIGGRELVCFGEDHHRELYMCLMSKGQIFRIVMEDDPTSAGPEHHQPDKTRLAQNFPNPFNPVTNITYHLPETGYVILEILDPAGRLISTLTDETSPAGAHSVIFDATGLASGVYTYRLRTGNTTITRKMTIIK